MKAIPQLAIITSHSGRSVNFRCPYQANVMKTLEISSRTMGAMEGGSQVIRRLLRLDAEFLDEGHDQLFFLVEHGRQLLRRARAGFRREIGEALDDDRVGERRHHGGVE